MRRLKKGEYAFGNYALFDSFVQRTQARKDKSELR